MNVPKGRARRIRGDTPTDAKAQCRRDVTLYGSNEDASPGRIRQRDRRSHPAVPRNGIRRGRLRIQWCSDTALRGRAGIDSGYGCWLCRALPLSAMTAGSRSLRGQPLVRLW